MNEFEFRCPNPDYVLFLEEVDEPFATEFREPFRPWVRVVLENTKTHEANLVWESDKCDTVEEFDVAVDEGRQFFLRLKAALVA